MMSGRAPVSIGGALAVTLPAATAAALLFAPLSETPLSTVWPFWPLPTLMLAFYLRSVWYICRGLPIRHRLGVRHLATHLLGFTGALVLFLSVFLLESRLAADMFAIDTLWLVRSPSLVFLTGVVFSAYLVAVLVYTLNQQKAETRRLEAEMLKRQIFASQAQLKNLRSIIQPHFLFNTLNMIRPLITRRPAEAQAVVDHLAGFLQYTLRHLHAEWVTLADEIDHAEHYLKLERLRLGDRFRVSARYPEDASGLRVPSLVLLPLLENAIKHGFGGITEAGTLEIDISVDGEWLRIRVSNPHDPTGRRRPEGEGLGLSVLRQRLAGLYRRRIEVDTQAEGRLFAVTLALPLKWRSDDAPDLPGR